MWSCSGGPHIKMALWNTTGDFLACSGWTSALCEAGVATHLTRTRRSHQITGLTLTRLREHAWEIAARYDRTTLVCSVNELRQELFS